MTDPDWKSTILKNEVQGRISKLIQVDPDNPHHIATHPVRELTPGQRSSEPTCIRCGTIAGFSGPRFFSVGWNHFCYCHDCMQDLINRTGGTVE